MCNLSSSVYFFACLFALVARLAEPTGCNIASLVKNHRGLGNNTEESELIQYVQYTVTLPCIYSVPVVVGLSLFNFVFF